MSKSIRLLLSFLAGLVILMSLKYGGKVSFSDQLPIYDGLRNTSAIIFAVMGTWIALLYPGKLSQAFGGKSYKDKVNDIEQINRLFRPMIYSTVVLIVVTTASFAVPLATKISYLYPFKEVFRAASYGIIAVLTILQFWSIILGKLWITRPVQATMAL